jgi:hypothetical protein
VGPFGRGEAVAVAALLGEAPAALWARVRPPEAALAAWRSVELDALGTRRFLNGQAAGVERMPEPPTGLVAVRGDDGRFLGVGQLLATTGMVKPERILHANHPGPGVVRA